MFFFHSLQYLFCRFIGKLRRGKSDFTTNAPEEGRKTQNGGKGSQDIAGKECGVIGGERFSIRGDSSKREGNCPEG